MWRQRRLHPAFALKQVQYLPQRSSVEKVCFNFWRYSGYIVSAPPRVASNGMPYQSENSLRYGLVPGSQ